MATPNIFRDFLKQEASGGIVLMGAALAALIVANSPLSEAYFGILQSHVGPLTVSHWINDALMAFFFLLVGLEIKREMIEGQLSTWPRRILPGVAAAGGMIVPAIIYLALNYQEPASVRGWAIPTATDIAFALGVLSLLGDRVPVSLKVFLAALAILDDLGAVLIIALFYSSGLSWIDLGAVAVVISLLFALNRFRVLSLLPYLALGLVLWIFVYRSGVHATVAGVLLALLVPAHDSAHSPLHRLERHLHIVVPFVVVPVFGFANAGVSFAGVTLATFVEPVTLGIALGLVFGKVIGVTGGSAFAIKMGWAEYPQNAHWTHVMGVALLCGIGFTMSLFIGLLAFPDSAGLQNAVKLGILAGSLTAACAGALVMILSPRLKASSPE